ncbi:MarR family transcriptional regulator [bacterium]|nr:MAG: MarR family transcriptional regulator [bacterium]
MSAVTKVSQTKAVQVWEGLARLHSTMTAALEQDMLPKAGIPLGWYQVLAHLHHAPGAMLRFQDLARVAGITDSGASRRLEQMIKARLIDRRSCPTDRRGVYAHLTERGTAAYEKAHAVFLRSLNRNLGSQLEPDEADVMNAALSRITNLLAEDES